jgi:hypothetical protein
MTLVSMMITDNQPHAMTALMAQLCSKKSSKRCHIVLNSSKSVDTIIVAALTV